MEIFIEVIEYAFTSMRISRFKEYLNSSKRVIYVMTIIRQGCGTGVKFLPATTVAMGKIYR